MRSAGVLLRKADRPFPKAGTELRRAQGLRAPRLFLSVGPEGSEAGLLMGAEEGLRGPGVWANNSAEASL